MRNYNASEVLLDPTVSTWLKDAIRSLEQRDPIDAAKDAEVLARVFTERAERIERQYMSTRWGLH